MDFFQALCLSHELTQVQVDPVTRSDIYHRLLDLLIPCSGKTGEPLQIYGQHTLDAIQL